MEVRDLERLQEIAEMANPPSDSGLVIVGGQDRAIGDMAEMLRRHFLEHDQQESYEQEQGEQS